MQMMYIQNTGCIRCPGVENCVLCFDCCAAILEVAADTEQEKLGRRDFATTLCDFELGVRNSCC